MRFKVTGISNIVCCGCGGTTNVAPKRVYNTDDLTCNCELKEEFMKFTVTHISDIVRIDNNYSVRVLPDSVYMFDEDDNIEEINNANITMFDEPYHQYSKTAHIDVVGQDDDGNVLVQNVGDNTDRWIIPAETFNETYEALDEPITPPPAAEGAELNDPNDGGEDEGKADGADIGENLKQTKMFEDEPENVINPSETGMKEPEVREYLKSLGWQELLEAAKNNAVTKPPSAKREELEEMIIQKVFHE